MSPNATVLLQVTFNVSVIMCFINIIVLLTVVNDGSVNIVLLLIRLVGGFLIAGSLE